MWIAWCPLCRAFCSPSAYTLRSLHCACAALACFCHLVLLVVCRGLCVLYAACSCSLQSLCLVCTHCAQIFFDRRADSTLNLLTVNETAPDEIPEDKDNINGMQQLAIEATTINQNYSQQVSVGAQCQLQHG